MYCVYVYVAQIANYSQLCLKFLDSKIVKDIAGNFSKDFLEYSRHFLLNYCLSLENSICIKQF